MKSSSPIACRAGLARVLVGLALSLSTAVGACAHGGGAALSAAQAQAIVAAPDRSSDDREMDPGRKPAELLAFIGVGAGAKVADLAAGDGYTSELVARAVGPTGVVYAENPKWLVEKFVAEPWAKRLATAANKNVVRLDRELEDPLPPEAHDLDVVVMNLFYHDLYWTDVDRAKMNAAVMKALRPGGLYIVIDHSAKDGAGTNEVKELHRIEEKVVRADIEAAGFKLAGTSDFLRNPADKRDWFVFEDGKRGTTDRFALKYKKP